MRTVPYKHGIDKATSVKIANLSVLGALAIVFIHVHWDVTVGSPSWFMQKLVVEGVSNFAVQFFFIVSGFFLAAHFDEKNWWRDAVRKRFWSLIVPMYIWIVIGLLNPIPMQMLADFIGHRPIFSTCWNLLRSRDYIDIFGLNLSTGPTPGPLWYLRCLFLFMLVAPVFKMLVERWGRKWLAVAFVLMLASMSWREWIGGVSADTWLTGFCSFGFSLRGVFYFSLGIYLRTHRYEPLSNCQACGFALLAIALLTFRTICNYNGINLPIAMEAFFVPCLLLVIWTWTPSRPLPTWLRGTSFPIYLMHVIMFDYMWTLLAVLHMKSGSFIHNLLVVLGSICLSIMVCNIVKRFLPRVAVVLFSGR